jgi:hypothetical protein
MEYIIGPAIFVMGIIPVVFLYVRVLESKSSYHEELRQRSLAVLAKRLQRRTAAQILIVFNSYDHNTSLIFSPVVKDAPYRKIHICCALLAAISLGHVGGSILFSRQEDRYLFGIAFHVVSLLLIIAITLYIGYSLFKEFQYIKRLKMLETDRPKN